MTLTRIRILGSGSVKKFIKTENANDSGLDVVRIRESYQTKCECNRIRILESGFGNFYADPRFALDPYGTDPLLRIRSGYLLMFVRVLGI